MAMDLILTAMAILPTVTGMGRVTMDMAPVTTGMGRVMGRVMDMAPATMATATPARATTPAVITAATATMVSDRALSVAPVITGGVVPSAGRAVAILAGAISK